MEHVAAVPSTSSGRMSPEAMGLAVVIHGVAGLALWWMALHRPPIVVIPDPVEITIEQPRKAEPLPPPPPPEQQQTQKAPEPKPVPLEGISPPAEITADRRTSKPSSGDAAKDISGLPQESLEKEVPAPPPDPPPPQIAAARPETVQPPPPPPPAERVTPQPPPPAEGFKQPLPSVQAAPTVEPPPTPAVRPPPPPAVAHPPPPPPQPQQRPPAVAHPPPQNMPGVQPHPSPLATRPQQQPPQIARREEPQSSSPFVNPADTYSRALASDNYLADVVRKISRYTFESQQAIGIHDIVLRLVIARDGRLLGVSVVRSSGLPEVDQNAVRIIQTASPYPPLPPDMAGASQTFTLPLMSVPRRMQ